MFVRRKLVKLQTVKFRGCEKNVIEFSRITRDIGENRINCED